jgi:hypothetical protein
LVAAYADVLSREIEGRIDRNLGTVDILYLGCGECIDL